MSDSKPPEDNEDRDESEASGQSEEERDDGRDDEEGGDHDEGEEEDEKFDLDDLDELGVDGVVERLGSASEGGGAARRPTWLSAVVLFGSFGLLLWLWPDFRYWVGPSDPVNIGDASEWVQEGKVPEGWLNTHVAIDGTPNVKWAMLRGSGDGDRKSFFDLVEAPGQLFVITPQVSAEHETRRYPGHFEGRMLRLGDDAMAMTRMAQLFEHENVTRSIDITPESLKAAREADGLTFATKKEGSVELVPEDSIRFVAQSSDARVLLGGLSFRNGEEAEAAVAELGFAYHRLPDLMPPEDPRKALGKPKTAPEGEAETPKKIRPDSYRFVVRMPDAERMAAKTTLEGKMVREADPTDHRQGVSVFARQGTYLAPAGSVTIAGDDVVFPYGENTTSPGYTEKDGKLVERELSQGRLQIPLTQLAEVRLEKPIVVDPEGYLLVDGFRPDDVWKWGIAFLGVLAITAVNGIWLLFGLMRRRA